MSSIRTHDLDPEIWDENGILRDGATFRVPMRFRDTGPVHDRALTIDEMHERMADHRAKSPIHDGTTDPWALSKPGFRYNRSLGDDQRQKVIDAHAAYVRDLESAWKTTSTAGSHPGGRVGDQCTVNGRPGVLEEDENGELICRATPDNRPARNRHDGSTKSLQQLQRDHAAAVEIAYAAYAKDLSESWRSK